MLRCKRQGLDGIGKVTACHEPGVCYSWSKCYPGCSSLSGPQQSQCLFALPLQELWASPADASVSLLAAAHSLHAHLYALSNIHFITHRLSSSTISLRGSGLIFSVFSTWLHQHYCLETLYQIDTLYHPSNQDQKCIEKCVRTPWSFIESLYLQVSIDDCMQP